MKTFSTKTQPFQARVKIFLAALSAVVTAGNASTAAVPATSANILQLAAPASSVGIVPGQRHLSGPAARMPAYAGMPIRFEPNVGQAQPAVKYLAHSEGYSVGLTEQGAIFNLRTGAIDEATKVPRTTSAAVGRAQARLRLIHARPHPGLVAEDPELSYSNYFIGNEPSKWLSHVANFGAVRYREVYPGIDWVVRGNPQKLEYDFVVAPNARPQQIRLAVDGADSMKLDAGGDLLVNVRGQILRQQKPVVYQVSGKGEKKIIEGRYLIEGNQLAFELGRYDRRRELVIDPVLAYSTYLGGSGNGYANAGSLGNPHGNAIAVDGSGNAYFVGQATSADFPVVGPFQAHLNGSSDAFVSKFNPTGTALVYSTYLGGSGEDAAYGVAVDGEGNAYITGQTSSTDFPTSNPFQSHSNSSSQAFVTKLNPAGSALVYSTYLGGSGGDAAYVIALGSTGNAYVAGQTSSKNFPVYNAFQSTLNGNANVFVSQLDAAGTALVYSTYLGGSGYDYAEALGVDSSGSAYVSGQTYSSNFPISANPFQAVNHADGTAFLTKLSPSGNALAYSTYLGGSVSDRVYAIAVDNAGSAYVTGNTASSDFPLMNPIQATDVASDYAGFVTKFTPAGNALVYSTYLEGSTYQQPNAIAVDSAGNAYVSGQTSSPDFPTADPLQANLKGNSDAFVTELNATGSAWVYSTYLGGSGDDSGNAVAVDAGGDLYVAGYTTSSDFPTTAGAFQTTAPGGASAFVAKIGATPSLSALLSASPTKLALGRSTTLTWSSTDATSCTAGGAWRGSEPTSGTAVVTPRTSGTDTYYLICSGGGGTATASASVVVTPPPPTVTISAQPGQITVGESTSISWSAPYAVGCTASGAWSGKKPASGTASVAPATAGTYSYVLGCSGPGGTAGAHAVVVVQP